MGILARINRRFPEMTFREFQSRQIEFLMHGKNRNYSVLFPQDSLDRRIVGAERLFTDILIGMDHYTEGANILEQTPRNGEHLVSLRWLYPNSTIIFVVRNPFDVIQSNRETPWGTSNPLILFSIWARQYFEIARLAHSYGLGNFMLVRYSKLENPRYLQGVINRLTGQGMARRTAPVDVSPRNFAQNQWATEHMAQSVGSFAPRKTGKWTSRFPAFGRLGEQLILSSLRAARTGKKDIFTRIVAAGAQISYRVIKR